jgi:hypothetical protein
MRLAPLTQDPACLSVYLATAAPAPTCEWLWWGHLRVAARLAQAQQWQQQLALLASRKQPVAGTSLCVCQHLQGQQRPRLANALLDTRAHSMLFILRGSAQIHPSFGPHFTSTHTRTSSELETSYTAQFCPPPAGCLVRGVKILRCWVVAKAKRGRCCAWCWRR